MGAQRTQLTLHPEQLQTMGSRCLQLVSLSSSNRCLNLTQTCPSCLQCLLSELCVRVLYIGIHGFAFSTFWQNAFQEAYFCALNRWLIQIGSHWVKFLFLTPFLQLWFHTMSVFFFSTQSQGRQGNIFFSQTILADNWGYTIKSFFAASLTQNIFYTQFYFSRNKIFSVFIGLLIFSFSVSGFYNFCSVSLLLVNISCY